MRVDYLVVGSGLTGAVIARLLADSGREVVVVERRNHLGGNVHDHIHPSGICVHSYGPHYFRTDDEEVWRFVHRFTMFHPFEAIVKTVVDGVLENWPVAMSYIQRACGRRWQPGFTGVPRNFEEASLAMMPPLIYEKFVKGYTEKQWGVPARSLSANLAGRFDVREDDEPRLKRHRYQGIPLPGYAHFMRNLLNGIPLILNCDYLRWRDSFTVRKKLVFTGPIDEFFHFKYGRLTYRSQQRSHTYLSEVDLAQPCIQINNPDPGNGPHIRTLEWKHMMPADYARRIRGTVLTAEIPFTPQDPDRYEYPFPDERNARLYQRYRRLAQAIPRLLICGRLGEYRYYDMDQAIVRAMDLANRLILEDMQTPPDIWRPGLPCQGVTDVSPPR